MVLSLFSLNNRYMSIIDVWGYTKILQKAHIVI